MYTISILACLLYELLILALTVGHSRSRIPIALRNVECDSCSVAERALTPFLPTDAPNVPINGSSLPERHQRTRKVKTIKWVTKQRHMKADSALDTSPHIWETLSTQFLPEVRDWTIHTVPYFQQSLWVDTHPTNFGSGEGEAYGNVAITMIGNYFQMLLILRWEQKRGQNSKVPICLERIFLSHNCCY